MPSPDGVLILNPLAKLAIFLLFRLLLCYSTVGHEGDVGRWYIMLFYKINLIHLWSLMLHLESGANKTLSMLLLLLFSLLVGHQGGGLRLLCLGENMR